VNPTPSGEPAREMTEWKTRRGTDEWSLPDDLTLKAWVFDGRIAASDAVWSPATGKWTPARDVAEIAVAFARPSVDKTKADVLRLSWTLFVIALAALPFGLIWVSNLSFVAAIVAAIVYHALPGEKRRTSWAFVVAATTLVVVAVIALGVVTMALLRRRESRAPTEVSVASAVTPAGERAQSDGESLQTPATGESPQAAEAASTSSSASPSEGTTSPLTDPLIEMQKRAAMAAVEAENRRLRDHAVTAREERHNAEIPRAETATDEVAGEISTRREAARGKGLVFALVGRYVSERVYHEADCPSVTLEMKMGPRIDAITAGFTPALDCHPVGGPPKP